MGHLYLYQPHAPWLDTVRVSAEELTDVERTLLREVLATFFV
jgi:hypothetical protein